MERTGVVPLYSLHFVSRVLDRETHAAPLKFGEMCPSRFPPGSRRFPLVPGPFRMSRPAAAADSHSESAPSTVTISPDGRSVAAARRRRV